jgi:hypothetical protein
MPSKIELEDMEARRERILKEISELPADYPNKQYLYECMVRCYELFFKSMIDEGLDMSDGGS